MKLPAINSPVRALFDMAHLVEVAAPANRDKLPSFPFARRQAKEFLAADPVALSVNSFCLRANGEFWLCEFRRSGAWKRVFNFGALSA